MLYSTAVLLCYCCAVLGVRREEEGREKGGKREEGRVFILPDKELVVESVELPARE